MKKVSFKKTKKEPISHSKSISKRVAYKKGNLPHVPQVAEVVFEPGDIAPAHIHEDMYELFYVSKGAGMLKVGGKVNKIEEGDVIIVEPGDSHEFLNNTEGDMVMFYFGVVK
jgi:quercetin dioxygenase-like cupin family protein